MTDENKSKAKNYLILLLVFLCLRSCYNASVDIPSTYTNIVTKNVLRTQFDTIFKTKIKNSTQYITKVETETKIEFQEKTVIKYVNNDSMPTYTASFNDRWSKGNVIANKDNIKVSAIFKDYSYLKFDQKRGLFKLKPIEAEIVQQNPNTIIKGVSSYQIIPRVPPLNVSAQITGGVNVLTGDPALVIGVGVGYNLLNAKSKRANKSTLQHKKD